MPKLRDLTGETFGRWVVKSRANNYRDKSGRSCTAWNCVCECGTEKTVLGNSLKSGRSTSCGCAHSEKASEVCTENFKKHGDANTRLYKIWIGMRKRCLNPKSYNYSNYGGRGIAVCDDWMSYENFRDWAVSNGYSDSLSLDRKNFDGDYSPDNCRWITTKEQNNNRRSNKYIEIDGVTHTISEWCEMYNLDKKRIYKALHSERTSLEEIINQNSINIT